MEPASGVNSVTSARDPTSETSQRSEAASLYRLMSWLTPAYPVGAYAYSGGIEWAVEAGDICDGNTLRRWLATLLQHGNLFSDAVIFVNAHRAVARRDAKAIASSQSWQQLFPVPRNGSWRRHRKGRLSCGSRDRLGHRRHSTG